MALVESEVIPGALPALTGVDRLIESAMGNGLDVESLGKLLALRDAQEAKQAKREFDSAMSSFQGECPVIERKKKGSKANYAPLEDIAAQVSPLLAAHGLSYRFNTQETERSITLECIITHRDGHSESSEVVIPAYEGQGGANAAQVRGGQITYGRRFAFTNALGILTGDEDMDARLPEDTSTVSAETAAALREFFEAAGGRDEAAFLGKAAGVSSFEDLPNKDEKRIRGFISMKAERGKNA